MENGERRNNYPGRGRPLQESAKENAMPLNERPKNEVDAAYALLMLHYETDDVPLHATEGPPAMMYREPEPELEDFWLRPLELTPERAKKLKRLRKKYYESSELFQTCKNLIKEYLEKNKK